MSTDVLVPTDAEQAVLGAILLDGAAFGLVFELVGPEDFARDAHRRIYRAFARLTARGVPLDPVTVISELESGGELSNCGGRDYVAELAQVVPTAANVQYYAGIVRNRGQRRALAARLDTAIRRLQEGETDAQPEAQALIQSLLPVAADDGPGSHGLRHIASVDIVGEIVTRGLHGPPGVRCGFPEIDTHTAGFRPGELIVVGGTAKSGKTMLAATIALDVALTGAGVALFSAEGTALAIKERLLVATGRVSAHRTMRGNITAEEAQRLSDANRVIDRAPLWIDDTGCPPLDVVVTRALACKAAHPELALVVVDFLQLVQNPMRGRRGDEELSAVAYGLAGLAMRAGVAVLATAQLNYKQIDARPDRRPELRDLQGASGMAQAATFPLLVHRPGQYDPNADPSIEVFCPAPRRGPPWSAWLTWHGDFSLVSSPQRDAAIRAAGGTA